MYVLKITGLTQQNDIKSLVRILLDMPGLNSERVSTGLKVPPLEVLAAAQEEYAQAMKNTLEKFGAICEIEDTDIIREKPTVKKNAVPLKPDKKSFVLRFWLMIFAVLALFALFTLFFSGDDNPSKPAKNKPKKTQILQTIKSQLPSATPKTTPESAGANTGKSKDELSNELAKNPYNTQAWKDLYEKLAAEGNTTAAKTAKENYEKSEKVQMVLASLAKAFGNNVRVEIKEDAVYYRTSKNFSESEFHLEAEKLRDTLSIRFPGKQNLVIENYTSNNTVQRIILEPSK